MRLAVISDIHGNLEAFSEVLSDIDRCAIDAVVCLGDLIGYGPEPDQVIALLQKRNIPSIRGNHELGVMDATYLNWFNPRARRSLEMTIDMLSLESLRFISKLKPCLKAYECHFVHGFPPESATIYFFQASREELLEAFGSINERLCFIGHTHTLEMIEFDGQSLKHSKLSRGFTSLHQDHRYIINIGSVGQPRDGNNNAKYVIWDAVKQGIEVRFVPYDINSVVRKIQLIGLPIEHASRLL